MATDSTDATCWRLEISGMVQGVGFRPFVHNLARELGLAGWVRNVSGGVEMQLQGSRSALEQFADRLDRNGPPLAEILEVQKTVMPVGPDAAPGLEIRASHREDGRTLVSPDVATCADCLREIRDESDRRCGYAFTNCTHCGPRFTIITDLPYDRPLTSMSGFAMCAACEREYADPENRRFHAQPVACPACGPIVWYAERAAGSRRHCDAPTGAAAIAAAVTCLNRSGVLAVKGLGGYHLSCRADDSEAVGRLRTSKFRPSKPFAVMVQSVEAAASFGTVGPEEAALLEAPEAPIVLLRKRRGSQDRLTPQVSPQNGYVGTMMPYTPLHHLLLGAADGPLVMTSGNRTGEPLCTDNAEAWEELAPFADAFLYHNRPIARPCDDSVMFVVGPPVRRVSQPVRRSRGLAPIPVLLPKGTALKLPVVAAGADLKNVSALAAGRSVFLTHHIGELSSPNVRKAQAAAIRDFERLFRIAPEAAVCDLHPDYASTRYARRRSEQEGLQLIEVQHHHAHVAACLAENGATGPAIGLSFDGTGYGTDGRIWGGEVMLADLGSFERRFHLQYLPLPGGDSATRQPYRIAIAYLRRLLPNIDVRALFPWVAEREIDVVDTMVSRGVNAPLTSSLGRWFDAVSALLGLCRACSHEAQAAMALEHAALRGDPTGRPYAFRLEGGEILLDGWLSEILADLGKGETVPDIARRFHRTVAEMSLYAACSVREQARVEGASMDCVALSGGVWQNRLLLEDACAGLQAAGFRVLVHRAVPPNDGGIAYGQAAVAAARMNANHS